MKNKMYKKESHYGWTAGVIIVAYVLFMSYLFKKEWANTPYALNFISGMANIIPVINNLMEDTKQYTNFWGIFYAIFWVISPTFLILGYMSAFFFPDEKYNNIMSIKYSQFLAIFGIVVGLFMYIFFFPLSGIFINNYISQISNLVIFRVIAWGLTVGIIYLLGVIVGSWYIRFNLNVKYRKEIK